MARINRENVFVSYVTNGSIEICLETEITAVDCINEKRDVHISLIAVNNTDREWLFYSGNTYVSALGQTGTATQDVKVSVGETVLASCDVSGVSGNLYPNSIPVDVSFAHICPEAGFTDVLSASRDFTLGPIVKGISSLLPKIDQFLGDTLYLQGVVLDEGYDAFVDVFINGYVIDRVKLDRGDWALQNKLSWAEHFPNSTYSVGDIYIWAACKGQALTKGVSATIVFNIRSEDAKPMVSIDVKTSSFNAAVEAFGYPVRNKSTVTLDARGCQTKYGATVKELSLVLDGQNTESDIYTTDILTEKGVHTYSLTVVDSRGFKDTVSGSFEVLDYAPPTAKASVLRCDENGTPDARGKFAVAQISCNDLFRYDGANESYLSYTLCRKSGNGEETGEVAIAKTEAACLFDLGLDIDKSYEFKLICRDDFGGMTIYTFDLDCERIELNLAKNKVAVGKYAVTENLFDCAWPARINGDVTFTDENENEVSLRSALLSGESAIRFRRVSVQSEDELEAALAQSSDGLCVVVAAVAQESRVYLLYKLGDENGRLKLFCE